MSCRGVVRRAILWVCSFGLLGVLAGQTDAGTTGKITGRVLNDKKEPVIAVTCFLDGTKFGAYSNDQGQYTILNVPAGTYTVRFQRVGYTVKAVQGVVVSSDQTTTQD